ncbi:hypothetical protein HY486_02760 [Candidatus Woesearchaeota archaeon]|nr:hypothetical protein [Candidatus Woesearchaeota archaeon]
MVYNAIQYLQSIGFIDLIIPFLVFFTIIFALLQRSNLFERRINAIISLAFSLMIVLPHVTNTYPTNFDPVVVMNQILPSAGVLTIVILLALMIIGLTGAQIFSPFSGMIGIIGLIVLAIIVIYVLTPQTFPWLYFLNDPGLQSAIIVLLVFALVVWFVMREDNTPENETPEARNERTIGSWRRFFGYQ